MKDNCDVKIILLKEELNFANEKKSFHLRAFKLKIVLRHFVKGKHFFKK